MYMILFFCSKLHNKDHEGKKFKGLIMIKKIVKLKLYCTWLISCHFPEEGSKKKNNVMVHNKDHEWKKGYWKFLGVTPKGYKKLLN